MNRRRNLRDEEARVIGVQDNAADEMRRVKARRPHDAAERRDKKSQESRVGSRERNARDEMTRLRGKAVGMGMKTGGKTVKKNMGGGMDEGISAAIKRSSAGAQKKASSDAAKRAAAERAAVARQAAAAKAAAEKARIDAKTRKRYPTNDRVAPDMPETEPPRTLRRDTLRRDSAGAKTGGRAVKKNMGGGIDAGIAASVKESAAAAQKKASEIDFDAIASNPRVQLAKKSYEYEQTPEGKAFVDYMKNYLKDDFAEQRANKRSNWRADRAKKPLTGLDSEGEGNNKGGKVVKKKVGGKTRPRAPAPKPSSSRQMSMLIPQHKRMAMGENVLTGKMINKFDGGKLQKTKTPKRPYATTGVNLNMGAPKTRRTTARGMGAALRGGNFTENT